MDRRIEHTTMRQGTLDQFVAFLEQWKYRVWAFREGPGPQYENREISPLWLVGPSREGAAAWCWIHVKQEYRKPVITPDQTDEEVFAEVERWSGRGCISAVETPQGIMITFETRGFPDPDLFWKCIDELLREMDRLGFAELSVDKLPELKTVQGDAGKNEGPAEALFTSFGSQLLGEADLSQIDRSKLLLVLGERFDQENLRTLCFHLGVEYDDLPGEGKVNKARELIRYLERRGRIGELVGTIERLRPDVSLGNVLEATKDASLAKTELLLALDRWWQGIKDYEYGMGEMGSASEAGIVPQDNSIAVGLEDFRISKIKAWPLLGEGTRNAFNQAERVFLGFTASIYSSVYGHEVFGDQVPREIARNEEIAEIIGSHDPSCYHTFSECKQAYWNLRAQLGG